jgi:predicted RNA-binding protein YlqC (UPF0109 family)
MTYEAEDPNARLDDEQDELDETIEPADAVEGDELEDEPQPVGPVEQLAEFVEFMVGNLVDDPDSFQVIPERYGTNIHIKVIVPEEEMGKVIGRQGRIARSMRTLLTIAASRKGLRASLDIDS